MTKLIATLSVLVAFAAGDELLTLLIVCGWFCAFAAQLAKSAERTHKHDIHADDFYF